MEDQIYDISLVLYLIAGLAGVAALLQWARSKISMDDDDQRQSKYLIVKVLTIVAALGLVSALILSVWIRQNHIDCCYG